MTESEEQSIQERLRKAKKLKEEIRSLDEFMKAEGVPRAITTCVYLKTNLCTTHVLSLGQETQDAINEAVTIILRSRYHELRNEYDKL